MGQSISFKRPLLRTRGFSTLHIDIFEMILAGKTNREINKSIGYSLRSHAVVDHSKLVMYKLLSREGLCKRDYVDQVVYPRKYLFWWRKLFDEHHAALQEKAKKPKFYVERDGLLNE